MSPDEGEIQGTMQELQGTTPTTPTTPTDGGGTTTGDSTLDEILKSMQAMWDKFAQQGMMANPNIQLTDEQLGELMKMAESQISPYFQTQLRLARENLLRTIGYSTEELGYYEADLEKKYGRQVRQLGESMAEQGFALSGMRRQTEQELATDVQSQVEANRRQLAFGAGTLGREFAQQWAGIPGYEQPSFTIPGAPRVLPGETTFQQSGGQTPFYELSPNVYQGLIGEQEKQRLTGKEQLARSYEQLARGGQTIEQIRKLML